MVEYLGAQKPGKSQYFPPTCPHFPCIIFLILRLIVQFPPNSTYFLSNFTDFPIIVPYFPLYFPYFPFYIQREFESFAIYKNV